MPTRPHNGYSHSNMLRDEAIFPNPEEFRPERYLEEVDEATAKLRDVRNYVFGFGRRKCPGSFMIDASLWIAIASIVSAFDISKHVDSRGQVVEPDVVYDNSVFTTLKPFKYDIRPRSAQAVTVIREAKGLSD